MKYPGAPFQALVLTFGAFFGILGAYKIGLRVSGGVAKAIVVMIAAVCIFYIVDMILGAFGHSTELVNGHGPWAIAINVAIVLLATISFVLDFQAVDDAVARGVDADESWRLAFGLLVGLVWLYLEILRLIIKLRTKD